MTSFIASPEAKISSPMWMVGRTPVNWRVKISLKIWMRFISNDLIWRSYWFFSSSGIGRFLSNSAVFAQELSRASCKKKLWFVDIFHIWAWVRSQAMHWSPPMSELFPAHQCVFNLICIFVAFRQRLINLCASSLWNWVFVCKCKVKAIGGQLKQMLVNSSMIIFFFCDLLWHLSIYRLYLNHDYLSVLPETPAAKCEAYWRQTQTSGRKHKQKLQKQPSAQQKSLPSLRRDQWQFEP